ncbi:MAG TPA: agmatine deiminase family protein [Flavobacterium sp.]|nr:agmatine deiminase family protein [Flavobacterium sp.]
MISDSQTNKVFLADGLKREAVFQPLTDALKQAGVEHELLAGASNIWCRDYMPIQTENNQFVLFKHDDTYGKATPTHGYGNIFHKNYSGSYTPSEIVLDGGNVVKHKDRVIITQKVVKDNGGNESTVRKELEKTFNAEIFLIPTEPYDALGHADGMVRFLDEKTVLVNDYGKAEYSESFCNKFERSLTNAGLEIKYMPFFNTEDLTQDKLPSAVGYYINFLQVGTNIFLPQFSYKGFEHFDEEAAQTIRDAFGVEPVPIPCYELAKNGGGILNCISWTVMS